MTDHPVPADPPSPLTTYTPGQVEKLRAEWAEHPDWFGYNVGRWIATLDAARAPDAGLRAEVKMVLSAMRTFHHGAPDSVVRTWETTLRAALASSPAPAGHGPWCVQDGHDDSAEPFVHGPDCRRDDTPAESPAPAGLDKLPRCEHGAIREPCVPCSEFKP